MITADAFGMIIQKLTKQNLSYSTLGKIVLDLDEMVEEDESS